MIYSDVGPICSPHTESVHVVDPDPALKFKAEILSVDPRQFRDAYKFAEHAVTQAGTQAPVQLLIAKFGLSQPEAMAVTVAVGGTVHVGKDRLNQEDIYLTLKVARLLGVEQRVLAFFERIGVGPSADETGKQSDKVDY